MSIVSCDNCDREIDSDYNSDELVGSACVDCFREFETTEVLERAKLLVGADLELVAEILVLRAQL